MALGLKYWFSFTDEWSRVHCVQILKEGYSSTVTELTAIGDPPVLITKPSDGSKFQPIQGKEIALQILSETDMEFSEFFTATNRDYLIRYWIENGDDSNLTQFNHSLETKGYAVLPFNAGVSTPIYYYNRKTYSAWMQRITTGYDSRAMIWAYDHKTNIESANYDLKSTSEVTGNTDNHPIPSVIVADDGHILVAQEFPRIGLGNHNDAITIKRSDNAEDETSWVNAKAETAGYWTFIGTRQPDNSARLAYQIFHKDNKGYK